MLQGFMPDYVTEKKEHPGRQLRGARTSVVSAEAGPHCQDCVFWIVEWLSQGRGFSCKHKQAASCDGVGLTGLGSCPMGHAMAMNV